MVAPPCTSLRHSSHTTPVHTSQLSPSRRGSTPCTSPVHLPYTFPSSGRHDVEAPPCTSLRYSPSRTHFPARRQTWKHPLHLSPVQLPYHSRTHFPTLTVTMRKHHLHLSPVQLPYPFLPSSRRHDVEAPPAIFSGTAPVHTSRLSPSGRGNTSLHLSPAQLPYHSRTHFPALAVTTWKHPLHLSPVQLPYHSNTYFPVLAVPMWKHPLHLSLVQLQYHSRTHFPALAVTTWKHPRPPAIFQLSPSR